MADHGSIDGLDEHDIALIGACTLSGFASLVVIVTYWRYRSLRRHPSQLILSRSVVDLVFVTGLVMSRFTYGSATVLNNCAVFAFLTQFCGLAAEMYLLMLSVDLVLSITNPFTDYKTNTRRYHAITIFASLGTAIILLTVHNSKDEHVYGRDLLRVCWAGGSHEHIDPYIFALFTLPLAIIYSFSVGAVLFGGRRLRQGLPQSYEARMDVFKNSARYVVGYIAYWTVVGGIYVVIFRVGNGADLPPAVPFVLAIATGARGLVTLAVWLWTHDLHEAYAKSRLGADDRDEDESLAPHLNQALRSEILTYVTAGILKSMRYAEQHPGRHDERNQGSRPFNLIRVPRLAEVVENSMLSSVVTSRRVRESDRRASVLARPLLGGGHRTAAGTTAVDTGYSADAAQRRTPPALQLNERRDHGRRHELVRRPSPGHERAAARRSLSSTFRFHDYDPHSFRKIRQTFDIDNEAYNEAFQATAKEVFSEGGSGAFMFFSGDQRFIVKTMSARECHVLLEILPKYAKYLSENPHTLICKFFGCHSIRMYRRTIYVVVMDNVLHTDATIHERYDLKGSWIDRQRRSIGRGERVRCRHCNQEYRVGYDDDTCPDRPNGLHRPNIILKDQDLNLKLHLDRTSASLLANQIDSDVGFLRSQSIMDYSLLLGVHRAKYRLVGHARGLPRLERYRSSTGLGSLGSPLSASSPIGSAASPLPGAPAPGIGRSTGGSGGHDGLTPLQRAARRRETRRTTAGVSVDDSAALLTSIQARRRSWLRREVSTGALSLNQVRAHTEGRGLAASLAASRTPHGRRVSHGADGSSDGRATATPLHRHLLASSGSDAGRAVVTEDGTTGHGVAAEDGTTGRGSGEGVSATRRSGDERGGWPDGRAADTRETAGLTPRPTVDLPPIRIADGSGSALDELLAETLATAAATHPHSGTRMEGVAIMEPEATSHGGREPARSGGDAPTGVRRGSDSGARPPLWPDTRTAGTGPAFAAGAHMPGRPAASSAMHSGAPVSSDTVPAARPHAMSFEDALLQSPLLSASARSSTEYPAPSLPTASASGASGFPTVQPFFKQHRGGLEAELVEGPGLYFLGIIDVLQRWDFWKRLEHFTKTRLLCRNRHGISAVHPEEYAERFYRRVAHEIIDNYDVYVPQSTHSMRRRRASTNLRSRRSGGRRPKGAAGLEKAP